MKSCWCNYDSMENDRTKASQTQQNPTLSCQLFLVITTMVVRMLIRDIDSGDLAEILKHLATIGNQVVNHLHCDWKSSCKSRRSKGYIKKKFWYTKKVLPDSLLSRNRSLILTMQLFCSSHRNQNLDPRLINDKSEGQKIQIQGFKYKQFLRKRGDL